MTLFKLPRFVVQAHDTVQVMIGLGLVVLTSYHYLVGG